MAASQLASAWLPSAQQLKQLVHPQTRLLEHALQQPRFQVAAVHRNRDLARPRRVFHLKMAAALIVFVKTCFLERSN
jgi:hypothetical protein